MQKILTVSFLKLFDRGVLTVADYDRMHLTDVLLLLHALKQVIVRLYLFQVLIIPRSVYYNTLVNLTSVIIQDTALLFLQLQRASLREILKSSILTRLIEEFCIATAAESQKRLTCIFSL